MGFIDAGRDPILGVSTFARESKGDIFRVARAFLDLSIQLAQLGTSSRS
jgi:hypothetical protein